MPRRDHIHADRDGMGADAVYGVSGRQEHKKITPRSS